MASDKPIHVTGVDLPPIVKAARELYSYPENFLWVASPYEQYRPTGRFDAVYCSHFLEYCPQDQLDLWLGRLRELVKPGGRIIFVAFLRPTAAVALDLDLFQLSTGLNGGQLGHLYTADEFPALMRSRGASAVRCIPFPQGPSYSEYLVITKWN